MGEINGFARGYFTLLIGGPITPIRTGRGPPCKNLWDVKLSSVVRGGMSCQEGMVFQ